MTRKFDVFAKLFTFIIKIIGQKHKRFTLKYLKLIVLFISLKKD